MSFKNVTLNVLYGSQTGNSQDVAERIWRESKRYYFTGSVKPMDEYDINELVYEKCIIFVCSTTGQGEEPDNMKHFWRFLLRKNLPGDCLSNLKFAVLGLGDSSYVKFNFAAKRLNKRLMQLGGEVLVPVGLGDDQHDLGYDAVADPWIESLWEKLLNIYPLPTNVAPLPKESFLKPRWKVETDIHSNFHGVNTSQSIYYSTRTPKDFSVTVIENNRTTVSSHFQDVRLIKLRSNGEPYNPGDVLVLRPKNLPFLVEEFLNVLQTNGVKIPDETIFNVSEISREMPVPGVLKKPLTFRQLCEEYFDLTAIPRRRVFEILAQLSDSELEKEKCTEFSTAEGQNDLYDYCNRPRRNIVEVLQDFPHATKNLTCDVLFEILMPIKPRDFSIASSFKAHENEIHILVAVVKYKTKLKRERLGLCSNYLADLKKGDELLVSLKKGSFKFPEQQGVPVIMVGPGTGMAPFRNYILECVHNNMATNKSLMFFFGCRGKNYDFHCKEELLALEKDNKINLICAFSRDQQEKVYVQHKITEHYETVWEILRRPNSHIFVAGNAKTMPQEVKEAFLDVCVKGGEMSKNEAIAFIGKMEKTNRYQTECWC